ncbi:MAG: glycosyltransferase, partial [Prevotella sp.]|nr:glycosyltransferase [Prevotella sp.]
MNKDISVGVIISTYNNPEWLKKTLWGYTCQTYSDFELIIADDGSDDRTRELIELFRN